MKKVLIFTVTGIILVAAYDQMARRGWVPKLFVKKTDNPATPAAPPIVKPYIKPTTGGGGISSSNTVISR
jgi:hypothetical protein